MRLLVFLGHFFLLYVSAALASQAGDTSVSQVYMRSGGSNGCLNLLERGGRELFVASKSLTAAITAWVEAHEALEKDEPNLVSACQNLELSLRRYYMAEHDFERCWGSHLSALRQCDGNKNKKLAKRRAEVCKRNLYVSKDQSISVQSELQDFCQ